MSETKQLIAFFHFLEGLKKLERYKDQVFWRDYDWITRFESVADHTWRMGMMLVFLEKKLKQPIDLAKALKLVLIHDLPEIIAGDPSPLGSDGTGKDSHRHDPVKKQEKEDREIAATKEIIAMLPEDLGKELDFLIAEYEKQETYESQVVKAIDKLEAKFQVIDMTNGRVYEAQKEPIYNYGAEFMQKEPIINEIFNELIKDFDKNYQEFKKVVM